MELMLRCKEDHNCKRPRTEWSVPFRDTTSSGSSLKSCERPRPDSPRRLSFEGRWRTDVRAQMGAELSNRAVLDITLSYAIGLGTDSLAERQLLLIGQEGNATVDFNSGG